MLWKSNISGLCFWTLTHVSDMFQNIFKTLVNTNLQFLTSDIYMRENIHNHQAIPGNVLYFSMFSQFVGNDAYCGSLESQSLPIGFVTFSRLIDVNYFVSHLILKFLTFWDLLSYLMFSDRLCLNGFLILQVSQKSGLWNIVIHQRFFYHNYFIILTWWSMLFHIMLSCLASPFRYFTVFCIYSANICLIFMCFWRYQIYLWWG